MRNRLNTVHISLKGVNLNRIYKECKKNNIELFNINRKDYKNIEFDIDFKNKNKIKLLAKKSSYEYVEAQNYGFMKCVNFIKYRFAFLIGALFFIILNIFSSLFIWDIKIYGNSKVSSEEILNVLKSQNICVGKSYNTNSLSEVENALINNIESISLCSVMKKGSTIIVNIKEKLKVDELTNINFENNIVAKTNMTIIELNVASGTALKKAGDSVKAGETIVASYIINDSGEKIACNANARIKAKTWHTATHNYSKVMEVTEKTGKVIKNSYLTLFDMKFNAKKNKVPFENFEQQTMEVNISKNNFLPFKFFVTTYYETVKCQVEQDFEKDKQNVIDACQKEAYKGVKSNETVTNIFDVIAEEDDRYVVTSYVEVVFEY